MEELTNYIHLSIHSFKRGDTVGAAQFLQFSIELFPTVFPAGKTIVKSNVLQLFEEPIRLINSLHWKENVSELHYAAVDYAWHIVEVLCKDAPYMLADIYWRVSEAKQQFGLLDEAIEYAGQSLVLCIKSHGLIHEKTADSHHYLASLYEKCGEFDRSKKEMRICRGIKSKVFGECSVAVAHCDASLGSLEVKCQNFVEASVYYYRSWRAKASILGEDHNVTQKTFSDLLGTRAMLSEPIIIGLEAKDRVCELGWDVDWSRQSEVPLTIANEVQYAVATNILQLNDDEILSRDTLALLVLSALQNFFNVFEVSRSRAVECITSELTAETIDMDTDAMTRLLIIPPSIKKRSSIYKKELVTKLAVVETNQTSPDFGRSSTMNLPRQKDEPILVTVNGFPEPVKKVPTSERDVVSGVKSTLESQPLLTNAKSEPLSSGSGKSWTDILKEADAASPYRSGKAKIPVTPTARPPTAITDEQAIVEINPVASTPISPTATGPPKKLANRRRLSSISDENYTLPFALGSKEQVLARDAAGMLVVIRLAIPDNDVRSKASKPSAAVTDEPKLDPRAALMTMLSKAGGKQLDQSSSVLPSKSGPVLARNASLEQAARVPKPPPLPSTWPPIPFRNSTLPSSQLASSSLPAADGVPPPPEAKAPEAAKVRHIAFDALEAKDGTIFAHAIGEQPPEVQMLFTDIDDAFSLVAKKAPKRVSKAVPLKIAPKQESILDPNRTQNISIMLAKFGRKPVADIVQSVLEFDADGLGGSAVASLAQYIPTNEDLAAIDRFLSSSKKKDTDQKKILGKAEEYLLAMSKLRRCEERLSAMSAYLSNQDTLTSIQSSAEAILKAVTEVRGSSRLKYLFNTILDIGNMLAEKSKKVAVVAGFKLSSLPKLTTLKANSGDTLLQYIVSRIFEQVPEALNLGGDMPSLNEARLVVFARLQSDLHKMEHGVSLMAALQVSEENEVAKERLKKFRDESQKLYVRAQTKLTEALSDFKDLVAYFGEDSSALPETLFAHIQGFIRSVEACVSIAETRAKKAARVDMFKRI